MNDIAEQRWRAVLPPDVQNEENSLLFLSRMTYIAFAEYLFNRGIIHASAFNKRRLIDGNAFHTFSNKSRYGSKLRNIMKGIHEAIQQKYARQAMIVIGEDSNNPDVASEIFCVSYAYDEKDCFKITDEQGKVMVSLGYSNKETFRMQVASMINTITHVTSRLGAFYNEALPAIKMTYYETTPEEYEPSFFKQCERTFHFDGNPAKVYLGYLSTSYSAMLFDLKSHYLQNTALSDNEQEIARGVSRSTIEHSSVYSSFYEQEVPRSATKSIAASSPVHGSIHEEEVAIAAPKASVTIRRMTPTPTFAREPRSASKSIAASSPVHGSIHEEEVSMAAPRASVTIRSVMKSPNDSFENADFVGKRLRLRSLENETL